MFLRFGLVPTVVITSKEAAEEVLKIECCSRPEAAGNPNVHLQFNIREEENDLLVKKLTEYALRLSPVNMKKTIYVLVGSILCRFGFGQSLREC
ncbi:unnamed protein product [Arabis nemorensis]|uniref:Uncharacterized protein n=1 Tax=Arabis nemorensis TaxID=586526 RepID=A0A565AMI9_9BRAS|nr:unnamed protein product [Arabis nemorensis]